MNKNFDLMKARKVSSLTQEQLAEKVGCSVQTITKLENDVSYNCGFNVIKGICKTLGEDLNTLFGGTL